MSRENENDDERLDRELIELLNELRVLLPGVQVLFAFLLTVPFTNQFSKITNEQKQVFFATFVCTVGTREEVSESCPSMVMVVAPRRASSGSAIAAAASDTPGSARARRRMSS